MAGDDLIRGLTVARDNTLGADAVTLDVGLCSGARVYSFTLCATAGATIHWQDSELVLDADGCSISADLPGLLWPAHARLEIPAGSSASLHVVYGHCA